MRDMAAQPVTPWSLWQSGYEMRWMPRSARCCSGTRCASAATTISSTSGQGSPPVLHFDYETMVDGRTFERPVNYALVAHHAAGRRRRSIRSAGRTSSSIRARATARASAASRTTRRSASRCAPATRCTSSSSSRSRSPGRRCSTCAPPSSSSCARCASLHPDSPKPAIVGNCQGGWAAMMLAAADPDDTGPIVINGAPMSYWGGAWRKARATTRCATPAGCSAASWLASFAPTSATACSTAPTWCRTSRTSTPPTPLGQVLPRVRERRHRAAALPRVRALVGRLLSDEPRRDRVDHAEPLRRQQAVDGRRPRRGRHGVRPARRSRRRSFCSRRMGDNITPPQQAFNWVADSTAAPRRSRRAARSSSACCTRTSATSASSCPARSRRRSTRRSSRC